MSYRFISYSRLISCINGLSSHRPICMSPREYARKGRAEESSHSYGDPKDFEIHCSKEENIFSSTKKNYPIEKDIVFDNNPDKFGTLSSNRMMRQIVECDGEEDDVIEVNYLDGIEGKTKLKPVNYAMMIKEHLQENRVADALAVLENTMLKEHKARPDLYIYNLLISGCAAHGYTKKAFQLFNQMKKRGIQPRLSTYTSLFNACSNGPWDHDSLGRARHLRELMLEKGISPNVVIYNAMIKAFGRHGDLETSFSIMDEMISQNMAIQSPTYNFLLQAAVSDKEAGFRHAILVWRKMLKKKIKPSTFTFNLLLRSVRDCGIGNTESAHEIVGLLSPPEQKYLTKSEETETKSLGHVESPNLLLPIPQSGSLVPDPSKITKPWHRLVLIGSVQGILSTMAQCKSIPNIKTFSLLLDILPNSDEMEEALITEMMRRNVRPDTDFCNMLIRKRNSSSRFDSALKVMNLMKEEKLKPNIMTFGVLAMGCNTLKSVKQLFQDIHDVGFRVNSQILTVLISRAKVSIDIDMVLLVVHKLMTEEIAPDLKFHNTLKTFRDAVVINMEWKENGQNHACSLDDKGFNAKFLKLLQIIEDMKVSIRDPSAVHPWKQFEVSAKA